MPNKCSVSAIIKSNRRHNAIHHAIPGLRDNARGGSPHLQYKQHDTAVHSDARYLSESRAQSRAGGHFFLSNDTNIPPNNCAVLNIAHIIRHVMLLATEAELAAIYIMAREAIYIRIILEEMDHKQPPTPVQTNNAMAEAVTSGKVQSKQTKAMDMRLHWLQDQESQRQFRYRVG